GGAALGRTPAGAEAVDMTGSGRVRNRREMGLISRRLSGGFFLPRAIREKCRGGAGSGEAGSGVANDFWTLTVHA
ncbi:MAG TPA: hypothetical protein VN228_16165, partial [Pyrinomonadaceae bacterium]|nr:hypothetical protein [Pyrinomonadaceae bacterium]